MKQEKKLIVGLIVLSLAAASCRSHFELNSVERSRILVDRRYDVQPDASIEAFLAPFKQKVDAEMNPVIGKAAKYLEAKRPESPLPNLLCDILMWGSSAYNEKPDFCVYNIGGIRAAIAEGEVTKGNIVDVAPFENKICFLSLKGDQVMQLFNQIAMRKGEGVSHGVELTMTEEGKLLSARLNGEEINPERTYRIVTIDYLAQGNDGLSAFKQKTDLVSPQEEENNVRYIIMNYFQQKMKEGKAVDADVEGRVKIAGN